MTDMEEALKQSYHMGALSGTISTCESMLAVIDEALEKEMPATEVIEVIQQIGRYHLEYSKDAWKHGMESIDEH